MTMPMTLRDKMKKNKEIQKSVCACLPLVLEPCMPATHFCFRGALPLFEHLLHYNLTNPIAQAFPHAQELPRLQELGDVAAAVLAEKSACGSNQLGFLQTASIVGTKLGIWTSFFKGKQILRDTKNKSGIMWLEFCKALHPCPMHQQ